MDFKELSALIAQVASGRKLDVEVINADLAEIIKLKYGIDILEKERDLIEEVKTKVITRLYNTDKNTVSIKTDAPGQFKLDALESDFLKSGLNELQAEGLITSNGNDITLTKEGIMKFKKFYGEI